MYKVGRSRTPQGVRGLKHVVTEELELVTLSHSARSAWIETPTPAELSAKYVVALRKECVD